MTNKVKMELSADVYIDPELGLCIDPTLSVDGYDQVPSMLGDKDFYKPFVPSFKDALLNIMFYTDVDKEMIRTLKNQLQDCINMVTLLDKAHENFPQDVGYEDHLKAVLEEYMENNQCDQ